jgi:serine/threonine protein kinase/tetratricopeptide (TPR) repeat protein
MPLEPGSHLGPYEIIALLGEGGMGFVYRARDSRLGREVAIKTIHEREAGDPEMERRFARETRAVAALSHPNIVAIYDVGQEGATPFAVTELLEGDTLRSRLRQTPLPWAEAVEIAAAIAEGLAAAHARGIVHRDLKPANVFLTREGRVKILDFGLATDELVRDHAGGQDATLSRRTEPGTLLGTAGYMSPEQARGDQADARSDIFALGSVLHEMTSGVAAFARPSLAETLAAVLKEDPPPLPEGIPRALARLIRQCLEKDRSRRFASAGEVLAELRAIAQGAGRPAGSASADRMDSLAVLPFADLSPQKDQEYFCDGLADELINALTRLRNLRVASRTSSFQFKGRAMDVREVGERLGVRVVVEGSVRKAGDRLRIIVQVTDVAHGFSLSSERYDRSVEDVFAIQDDITQRVVQALEMRLTEGERRVLEKAPTTDVRAYDLYLRGRGYFHQLRTAGLPRAREMFQAAVAADPTFALAHAALADVCAWIYQWRGRDPEHAREALSASARALELRPDLAEAHAARANALVLSGDAAAAEREYGIAIDLNPRLFEPHYYYARACLEQGRKQDAARLLARAAELQPEDYQSRALLAMVYGALGYPDRARTWYEDSVAVSTRHLERYPDDVRAVYMTGGSLIRLGERERGLEWVERARQMDPEDGGTLYNVACAYAVADRPEEALDTLELALDKAVTNLAWIANDDDLAPLRDHPRFQALLDRLR